MMSASVTEPTICWTSGEAARAASRRGSADSVVQGLLHGLRRDARQKDLGVVQARQVRLRHHSEQDPVLVGVEDGPQVRQRLHVGIGPKAHVVVVPLPGRGVQEGRLVTVRPEPGQVPLPAHDQEAVAQLHDQRDPPLEQHRRSASSRRSTRIRKSGLDPDAGTVRRASCPRVWRQANRTNTATTSTRFFMERSPPLVMTPCPLLLPAPSGRPAPPRTGLPDESQDAGRGRVSPSARPHVHCLNPTRQKLRKKSANGAGRRNHLIMMELAILPARASVH